MITDKTNSHINPAANTPEMLAKLLGLQVDVIRNHVQQGAPVALDGTMNLINYAAWLNTRINHGS